MNGFTFVAIVFIGYFIFVFAVSAINNAALYIARKQGERKALEWWRTQQRMTKDGEFNAKDGW